MNNPKLKQFIYALIVILVGAGSYGVPKYLETEGDTKPSLEAKITGPNKVPIGSLALLKADVTGSTTHIWYPIVDLQSFACKDDLVLSATSSVPRTQTYVFFASDGSKSVIAEHTIEFYSEGSKPEPNPDPNDTPFPPESGFGLKNKVGDWLKLVPNEALNNSKDISNVLKSSGNAAINNKYSTIKEVENATFIGLTTVIKNKEAWRGFGSNFQNEMNSLVASGKIDNPYDYGKALLEVSEGM